MFPKKKILATLFMKLYVFIHKTNLPFCEKLVTDRRSVQRQTTGPPATQGPKDTIQH